MGTHISLINKVNSVKFYRLNRGKMHHKDIQKSIGYGDSTYRRWHYDVFINDLIDKDMSDSHIRSIDTLTPTGSVENMVDLYFQGLQIKILCKKFNLKKGSVRYYIERSISNPDSKHYDKKIRHKRSCHSREVVIKSVRYYLLSKRPILEVSIIFNVNKNLLGLWIKRDDILNDVKDNLFLDDNPIIKSFLNYSFTDEQKRMNTLHSNTKAEIIVFNNMSMQEKQKKIDFDFLKTKVIGKQNTVNRLNEEIEVLKSQMNDINKRK